MQRVTDESNNKIWTGAWPDLITRSLWIDLSQALYASSKSPIQPHYQDSPPRRSFPFSCVDSSRPSPCSRESAICMQLAHLNFGVLIKLISLFPASPDLSLRNLFIARLCNYPPNVVLLPIGAIIYLKCIWCSHRAPLFYDSSPKDPHDEQHTKKMWPILISIFKLAGTSSRRKSFVCPNLIASPASPDA